jgi:D-alanyl-D-alanine carboxypeptidase
LKSFACALLVLVAAAGAASAADPAPEPLDARVDAYVKPYVAGGNFSGSVLIARQGKVLVNRHYGSADRELRVPVGPKTRFHLASVSKPFTAAAVLLLEQQGKLRTGDPLAR